MKILALFFAAVLLTLLLVTGCEVLGPQNEVFFKTAQTIYAAGDQVDVRIENESATKVGLNLCYAFLSLEHQASNNTWKSTGANLGPDPNSACNADMLLLASGQVNGGVAFCPKTNRLGYIALLPW